MLNIKSFSPLCNHHMWSNSNITFLIHWHFFCIFSWNIHVKVLTHAQFFPYFIFFGSNCCRRKNILSLWHASHIYHTISTKVAVRMKFIDILSTRIYYVIIFYMYNSRVVMILTIVFNLVVWIGIDLSQLNLLTYWVTGWSQHGRRKHNCAYWGIYEALWEL